MPVQARSTLKANSEFWYENLADCPDVQLKTEVFSGIERGVDIGCVGLTCGGIYDNWPSAMEHFDKVDQKINESLSLGRLVGPWSSPPCLEYVCSSGGSKIRLIHDLSYPPGKSVNDHINPEDFRLHYKSIDDAVGMCLSFDEPCFLAKSDLQSAFSHVFVQPRFWHLLGFKWREKFYASAVLPFGLRSSPALFEKFARALEYMSIRRGASIRTLHYLDDSITAGSCAWECKQSIDVIMDTALKAGFDLQPEKCTNPSQVIEFLGIQINTVEQTLSITNERLQEITLLLDQWIGKKRCTKRELLSLIGKLSFVSRVVRAGRTFLRRLICLSTKVKYLHYKVNLNSEARKDIVWWRSCIASHNGVSMFPSHIVNNECHVVWTDASDVALGAVFGDRWTMVPFVGDKAWIKEKPIHFREMLAVCIALVSFSQWLSNAKVLFMVDNQAIVHAVNNGSIKCNDTMELVRSLYFVLSKHNIECVSEYIPTKDNVLADALSRIDFVTFRANHTGANKCMTMPGDVNYYDCII